MIGRTLFIVVQGYPFDGESFLELELKFLSPSFEKILILNTDSPGNEGPQNYSLPSNARFVLSDKRCRIKMKFFFASLKFLVREFFRLLRTGLISLSGLRILLGSLIKSLRFSSFTEGLLKQEKGDCFLYTYWVSEYSLSLLLLKEQNKDLNIFSKAHAWDIYEFRHRPAYLPFRYSIFSDPELAVFFISQHAKQYCIEHYKVKDAGHFHVLYMGTRNDSDLANLPSSEVFTMVSCSSLIPLKRVHLIIDALALTDKKIRWIHFGDGPLSDALKQKAIKELSPKENISVSWKGLQPNAEIMEFYRKTPVDLFINVSEYEGLPVSVMEALSFGIPVLATDTGGVEEIVKEGNNGMLLEVNSNGSAIKKAIEDVYDLKDEKKIMYRENAYQRWKEYFNAEKNYALFLQAILNGTRR